MARHLDKDPATYCKERDGFIRDLQHFHETRGTPFRRIPTIAGHAVDLFLLYSLVTKEGGWMKINSRNGWEDLLEKFDLPTKCVNGGVALKQVYIRFLDRYEKVHFLGEEAERGSDDDDESRHKRWSARALHSVPLNYNYHQHNIADATRSYNGLSTTLYKPSDYDRLALSLISPLPNEQDFAVNVCTLLCNEGKHTLRLDKCPRLIDYLLAHTGVFNHDSLRKLFTQVYTEVRKHPLNTFWYDVLQTSEHYYLTNEQHFEENKTTTTTPTTTTTNNKSVSISPPSKWRTKTINNNYNNSSSSSSSLKRESQKNEENQVIILNESENRLVPSDNDDNNKNGDVQNGGVNKDDDATDDDDDDDDSDSELFASDKPKIKGKRVKLKLEPEDKSLFCTGRTLGTQDYVGQRVLQIAHILRNLSFTEDNIQVLAGNRTFLRFLLLCVRSRWSSIHQLGLDMLGNIASELTLRDQHERLAHCLIQFVTSGLHDQDRSIIIACLEILNKLSQREANEDFMLRALEKRAYTQVCSFLTLHDVMLLIYTLECLYSLSSLGERACNYIVEVHGIIDTLVALVTVEGKSYGPKACIGMKLVETVPGVTQQQSQQQQQQSSTGQQQTTVVATTNASISSTPTRSNTMAQPRNLVAVQPKPLTPNTTSNNNSNSNNNTPVLATGTGTGTGTSSLALNSKQQAGNQQQPLSAQHVLQQQHAHQQAIQENEQFALAWLRATYEPCGGKIEQQELYKQYLNSCAKIGRRGVIAPLHFPRCVRSVFGGTVGPNPIKTNDTAAAPLLYYEGIRPRIVPLLITLPSAALQQTVQHSKQSAAVQKRKAAAAAAAAANAIIIPQLTTIDTSTSASANTTTDIPNSPASPILKAQLSAPPKPRESPTKTDVKSQVLAHPHLSQALLGNTSTTTSTTSGSGGGGSSNSAGIITQTQTTTTTSGNSSSSSLIKSLLATKVNECMLPNANSMRIPATIDATAQVAQRQQQQQQQRLLAQQQQQQQQQQQSVINKKITPKTPTPKGKGNSNRVNGIRVSEAEQSLGSDSVSSSTSHPENHQQAAPASFRGRREPPQPPPPPLAPLSTTTANNRAKTPRMDNEDSDSIGNNSVASSTGISSSNVAVSSTEDGDNSLTSFEGILLNGIPHSMDIDAQNDNDDSNSKDSVRNTKIKPLMLADLLEKKVEKDPPPTLNGVLCKELRIGDKGLELVDNHINKVINSASASASANVITTSTFDTNIITTTSNSNNSNSNSKEVSVIVEQATIDRTQTQIVNSNSNNININNDDYKIGVKRAADPQDISNIEHKKRHLETANNLNGGVDSPKPESVDSNEDSNAASASVSATAANIYASLAADILEDEDEELLMQQQETPQQQAPAVTPAPAPTPTPGTTTTTATASMVMEEAVQQMQQMQMQQLIVTPSGQGDQQQLIVTPRQIIVSQGQIQSTGGHQQVVITAGGQLALQQTSTTQSLKPMLVHTSQSATNTSGRGQMVFSQAGGGQIHYVQHGNQMQQVQLVQATGAGGQPGQLVIQAPAGVGVGPNAQYVIAAQSQTALVQGQPQTVLVAQTAQQQGTTAKTIIILQQQQPNQATHHQKVVVTPQGQQVVVTQVQRPILQSPTVTNNIPTSANQHQHQLNNIKTSAVNVNANTTVITQSNQILIAPKDNRQQQQQSTSRPQTPIAVSLGVDGGGTASTTCITTSTISATTTGYTTTTTTTTTTTITTNNSNNNNSKLPPAPVIKDINHPWICEWRGCTSTKKFKSANEVYMHACEVHCPMSANTNDELQCLWDRCDTMRRKRFSLMTHLHDRHCSPEIMKAVSTRRKQLSQQGKVELPAQTPPPPHPGYAPDAALHAIKRHALEFVNPKELQDDNEGPVTKSIRLTASLILRNLVIYSNNSRRYLRHYEPHLAGVALSNVESSRTIAQLLYDLNDTSTARR